MRIAIHAFEGITMFHLSAPLLVFGEVVQQQLAAGWSTSVWTDDGRAVRTAEGLSVSDVHGPEIAAAADLLVFPSWPADFPPLSPDMAELIHQRHEQGARIAGLCLGAFPVADSGLVDGRTVVTHWAAADVLRDRRPEVTVDHAALYVDHGDVLTSAGTVSAIDACLHLVRTELGSEAAAAIARHLVVAPHREGGQAQYIDHPVPRAEAGGSLGPTIDWALAHLDQPLSIDELAAHARMSRRNFTRRFSATTGTTPADWVRSQRLDQSRRLLETTSWPIDRIAGACGFASAVTFRQNFSSAFATTPTSYRRRFRA